MMTNNDFAASEQADGINNDKALLASLLNNEPAAYEQLVRQHSGRMLCTARRLLRCEEDCNDAMQKAFISAFRAIRKFEGNSSLGTWLHRIVVNQCLMHLRATSRHPEVSIDGLLPKFDETGHHAQTVSAWSRRPEDELQTRETRSLVRKCIDQLPDEYRTVLLLRDIEEFSTEETAQQLETTTGAVKTRLHRARQALRTLLTPHFAN
jgi:RNA polymerase sigma-70 factor (ECF subfamily)